MTLLEFVKQNNIAIDGYLRAVGFAKDGRLLNGGSEILDREDMVTLSLVYENEEEGTYYLNFHHENGEWVQNDD
jgi:hypothetical protein